MSDTDETTEHPGDEASEQFEKEPPPEEVEEIEKERERRLDPENRPENAEVDNSGETLPTVEEFNKRSKDEEVEGSAGTSDPAEKFREMEISEEEKREMEEERQRRLAPENRPENAEVDNTGDKMPDIAKEENQPE